MKTATLFIPLTAAVSILSAPSLLAQNTPTKLTQPIVNAQAQNQAPAAEQRDAKFTARYGNASRAPATPPVAQPVVVPAPQQPRLGAPVPVAPAPAPQQRDERFTARYGVSAGRSAQPAVAGSPSGASAALPVVAAPVVRREDPEREQRIINFQRQNAISGNPSSQYDLGMRYVKGDGVEQDDKQALEWLKRSAKSGNGRAKKELAALEKRLAEKGKDAPEIEAPVAKAAKSESE